MLVRHAFNLASNRMRALENQIETDFMSEPIDAWKEELDAASLRLLEQLQAAEESAQIA